MLSLWVHRLRYPHRRRHHGDRVVLVARLESPRKQMVGHPPTAAVAVRYHSGCVLEARSWWSLQTSGWSFLTSRRPRKQQRSQASIYKIYALVIDVTSGQSRVEVELKAKRSLLVREKAGISPQSSELTLEFQGWQRHRRSRAPVRPASGVPAVRCLRAPRTCQGNSPLSIGRCPSKAKRGEMKISSNLIFQTEASIGHS
jgi:hypothetical protein